MRTRLALLVLVAAMAGTIAAQGQAPLFTDSAQPEEFAARRAKVFAAIGDGVAVLEGSTEYPAYVRFRQNDQFFYLTGVEVPRALVLLDGRAKQATLFVAPRNERLERSEGPVLVPGDEAAKLTGIDRRGRARRLRSGVQDRGGRPCRLRAVPCGKPRRRDAAGGRDERARPR